MTSWQNEWKKHLCLPTNCLWKTCITEKKSGHWWRLGKYWCWLKMFSHYNHKLQCSLLEIYEIDQYIITEITNENVRIYLPSIIIIIHLSSSQCNQMIVDIPFLVIKHVKLWISNRVLTNPSNLVQLETYQ